ncbi:Uncharacterised protein [Mycobacteroides abscessus subsp. abscessus]|nr:Uncharacterised protein [Mycobacteroides abscessus subsp. abscessus]
MDEEDVVAADVVTDLASGFDERERLDVADGSTDLGDDHVWRLTVVAGRTHREHPRFQLVGDVRDDLDGLAEVLAASLLGDDGRIHLSGGDIRRLREIAVEEALVMPDVEVGFGAILGDEDLTVLEGIHRAWIDVQIRIQFLHGHAQTARCE